MDILPIISFDFTPTFSSNSLFYFLFLILKKQTYIFLFLTVFMLIDFARMIYQFLIINFRPVRNHIFISDILFRL